MVAAVQHYLSVSLARALQVMPCSAVSDDFRSAGCKRTSNGENDALVDPVTSETRLESARAAAMFSDLMGTFMSWPPEGVAPFPAYPR